MLSHLLTQFIRSIGIFFRTIRAFFSRALVGVWTRFKRLTNFSRYATKVASDSLQSAASIAKKPTARGDYIETGRLFISKKLLLTLAVGLVALVMLIYFVIWPFVLGNFLTAHFYMEDARVDNWTGRAVVYVDEAKTIPLYEGRLEDGLLQGKGKQYDQSGLVVYEGEFVDGLWQGKGIAYENGVMIYEGDFAAGVYEGQGKEYTGGTLAYEGAFSGGVRAGEGTAYYASGKTQYKGTFANGLYEGTGTAYSEQGDKVYEGGFLAGKYSGQGSLYPENGQRVDANFVDGQPDGAIAWYKSNKLYYDGQAQGLMPSGTGILYTQDGKTAYVGQMANGTVDGNWLLTLTAAELREALGESKTQEYPQETGFVIAAPALGLSAACSYQTADSEAAVYAVYLSAPGEERFALLPGQDEVNLEGWEKTGEGQRVFAAVPGVSIAAGTYQSTTYQLENGQAEVLYTGDQAVLLSWQEAIQTAAPGDDAQADAEAQAAAEEQARVEAFLDAIDGIAGAGAAQQVSTNPYYGQTAVTEALAGCETAGQAEQAVNAMLDYWEQAERRLAAEHSLTRTQELLDEAQTALASGLGSEETVSELQGQVETLKGNIQTCTAEMSKATMTAESAGVSNVAQYALPELAAVINPVGWDVSELGLVAVAYAQATAADSSTVDTAAVTLSVKTSLVDLTTAYSAVQEAKTACEAAAQTASAQAGAFSMGTAAKADWYTALSAQADSQAALYASAAAYTRQLNALNALTGGWVSRTQGWMTDALAPLYQTAAQ